MKEVNIKIKEIRVVDFSARDCSAEFEIYFDKYKTVKKLVIDDPSELAHDLIVEIRRKVKEANKRPESDDILDNIVTVRVEKEEEVINKLSLFLGKLADKINEIKSTKMASNYMNSVSNVKNMGLVFN